MTTPVMEASVANLVTEGTRVAWLDVEWGRAADPEAVRRALSDNGPIVAAVDAERSAGVLNPIADIAA